MRLFLFVIAAILATLWFLCSPALAQQNLPEDRERYHLVIVTHDQPTAEGQRLMANVSQHPQLARIAAACATHTFKASDVLYRERYAASIPPAELPAIALCRGDGGVVYKAAGANVPGDPETLVEQLVHYAKIDRSLSGGSGGGVITQDCPDCPYRPQPPPNPYQPWLPQVNPQTVPWSNPDGSGFLPLRIPDSVEVAPRFDFSLPENLTGWLVGAGVVLLVLFGLGAFGFFALVALGIYVKG